MRKITWGCMLALSTLGHAQSFQWVKQFTGYYVKDLERDASGNVFSITDYRNQFTCGTTTYNASINKYVIIKYDGDGNCQWVHERPIPHKETAMDEGGNIYVTGIFGGTINYEGHTLVSHGDDDIYLAKYNGGGTLQWVTSFGGPYADAVNDLAVRNGSVYITGDFRSSIQVGTHIYNATNPAADNYNFYLARFNGAGTFDWLQKPVCNGGTSGWDLGCDNAGNAYVQMGYGDTTSFGAVQIDFDGNPYTSRALVKFNISGTAVWARNYNSTFRMLQHNLAVDASGNIYVVYGITYSALEIQKLNSNNVEQWATGGGGSYSTSCGDIKINDAGEVFITGTSWPGLAFGNTEYPSTNEGWTYTTKLSPSGIFKWTVAAQPKDEASGAIPEAIAVSGTGETYIMGHLTGGSGIVYFGPRTVNMNNGNVFFTKISESQLIVDNDPWKYLDNGSNQGTAWRNLSFNDSLWRSGNAELGYGDGDEATVISYGPNANNKYITSYFRRKFYVGDTSSFSGLEISLIRDDGAVVYINGTEVMRSNMPSGTITYTTRAPGFGNLPEETYDVLTIGKSALVEGQNEIAVEVHQVDATSSDLSFKLKMRTVTTTPPPPPSSTDLILAGASWKYLDNGSNQGTAWKEVSFNDGAWHSGNAELGYGDGGEATVVGYGPNSSNKYITTYFRKQFNVTDTSAFSGLELSLLRDDGAVVYINGTEVYRSNMPTGTIAYNTLAAATVDGTAESTYIVSNLSKSILHNGTNLVAVEIHQANATSSDISFNLKLKTTTTAPPPSNQDLILAGADWKYLDNGSNQGTAWRAPSFNDGAWHSGNAELGYGDGGEATVVSYGADASHKYTTTYFRKNFSVTDPNAFTQLELSLIRDDGAVVYLNGTEVYRNNMPSGAIAYNTFASSAIDGSGESTWIVSNISRTALVAGTNVIAVEIHQANYTSSDISFNLKLRGLTNGRVADSTLAVATGYKIENPRGDLLVYPNPNSGQFTIEYCLTGLQESFLTIEIVNTVGEVVYHRKAEVVNNCLKDVIELEKGLPSGMYILNISGDTSRESKQLVLTY